LYQNPIVHPETKIIMYSQYEGVTIQYINCTHNNN